MIVVYHQENKVVEVVSEGKNINFSNQSIATNLFAIAEKNSKSLIVWCLLDLKTNLNLSAMNDVFHHRKIMASYNLDTSSFLSDSIGYIEGSPFIKINKKESYPTWQMGSCVGGVHASVLLALKNQVKEDDSFDYFLHSVAKLSMPNGLLCYSEPKLLKEFPFEIKKHKKDNFVLFRFVRQHYKTRWVFLLFLNLFLYERKLAVLPLVHSFFYTKRKLDEICLDKIKVESTKKIIDSGTIDVIIPTIGRKSYLYDVLRDLSKQTHLPQNVIIVEQNPIEESTSELDFLTTEEWPFSIKHTFTHQAGACNSRNIALSQVTSEWVFMADDDIRIDSDFINNSLKINNKFGVIAAHYSCLPKNHINKYLSISQTTIFGSGCSIVRKDNLSGIYFDKSLEFGYGEDTDFGLQLRNLGVDIIYFPEPNILHLRAPIGGFRIKPIFQWSGETIQPKPSPTIMYIKLKYDTEEQLLGYKLVLFLKLLKEQSIFTLFSFISSFGKKWRRSLYWAKQLNG